MSNATPAYVKSLAASGTATVNISLDGAEELAVINVSAAYAAVSAAPGGLGAAINLSLDGSTFVASNAATLATCAPTAGNFVTQTYSIPLGDNPQCADSGRHFKTLQVALTNGDPVNAASVAVTADLKKYAR